MAAESPRLDDEYCDSRSYAGLRVRAVSQVDVSPGPAFEPSPAHEPADRPAAEHLQEWRDAAKRVARAHHAWCAASRSEQQERYRSFLDALRREEGAAEQVERDAYRWAPRIQAVEAGAPSPSSRARVCSAASPETGEIVAVMPASLTRIIPMGRCAAGVAAPESGLPDHHKNPERKAYMSTAVRPRQWTAAIECATGGAQPAAAADDLVSGHGRWHGPRISALAATAAPPAFYLLNLEAASELGLSVEQVQGVLIGIAPVVGSAHLASAGSSIAQALGLPTPIAEGSR